MTQDFLFLYVLLIHFFADFVIQTDDQARLKSTDDKWLMYHAEVYTLIWFIAIIAIHDFTHFDTWKTMEFCMITFILHSITDFCTSRIGKPFWEKKDYHNGFVVVGFDQLLHYLQLYYTFKLLL